MSSSSSSAQGNPVTALAVLEDALTKLGQTLASSCSDFSAAACRTNATTLEDFSSVSKILGSFMSASEALSKANASAQRASLISAAVKTAQAAGGRPAAQGSQGSGNTASAAKRARG